MSYLRTHLGFLFVLVLAFILATDSVPAMAKGSKSGKSARSSKSAKSSKRSSSKSSKRRSSKASKRGSSRSRKSARSSRRGRADRSRGRYSSRGRRGRRSRRSRRVARVRKPTDWTLSYTVRIADGASKLVVVDASYRFPDAPGPIDFAITDVDGHYSPGYAQFVGPVHLTGPGGGTIELAHPTNARWRPTDSLGGGEYKLQYTISVDHLSKPNSWGRKETPRIDAKGGILIGAALFIVPRAQASDPTSEPPTPKLDEADIQVSWSLPATWRALTPWPLAKGGAYTPTVVDDLLDNFLVVGPPDAYDFFEVRLDDSVVRAAIVKGAWSFPSTRLWTPFERIIRQSAAIFDGMPSPSYLLVIGPGPGTRNQQGFSDGGGAARQSFNAELDEKYTVKDLAGPRPLKTLAHETFHWWNPVAFPPAAGVDAYWWTEGITVYYETLLLWRAGIISQDDFVSLLSQHYDRGERRNQVRPATSLVEASRKITGDGGPDYELAYYLGAVNGFALDLEIRKQSDGARSLDDLLRELAARHARTRRGFTLDDLADEATLVAGADIRPFFKRYVEGHELFDWSAMLASIGYEEQHKPTGKPYLGITFEPDAAEPTVRTVQQGSPSDGVIKPGDVVFALGVMRTPTLAAFSKAIAEMKPGEEIAIRYRRDGADGSSTVTLGQRQELRAIPVSARAPDAIELLESLGRAAD